MKFSFLSWNVRNYRGDPNRLADADDLITSLDPDVFGLIEFRAKKDVRTLMFEQFREYDFSITDSRNGLELVVGVRRGKFEQVIWTQRRDFMVRNPHLRPGGLISVACDGAYYNLLFLHAKSGRSKADHAARQEMFRKIWKLRGALRANAPDGRDNLVVLGDVNTMGWQGQVTGKEEIAALAADAGMNGMALAAKDREATWHDWGKGPRGRRRKLGLADVAGAKRSDLDHVIHSSELGVEGRFPTKDRVHVLGWNQLPAQARIDFLWDLSDHSALYGRVA